MSAKEEQVIRKLVSDLLRHTRCVCGIKDNYRCYRCTLLDESIAAFPEPTRLAMEVFARRTPGEKA